MGRTRYYFVYKNSDGVEKIYHLTGNLVVGRSDVCHLVLDHEGVSRQHCELSLVPTGVNVVDLGSTNGTFLNGTSIKEAIARPGDRIVIGQACLVLSEVPQSGKTEAAATGVLGDTTVEIVLKAAAEKSPDAALLDASGVEGDYFGALFKLTDLVNSADDRETLLHSFLLILMDLFRMDLGAVYLLDGEGKGLRLIQEERKAGGKEYSPSMSVLDRVVQENVSVVAQDPLLDPRFGKARSIATAGTARILCVPMRTARQVTGAVYLSSLKKASPPGEEALQLLAALTSQATQAMENLAYRERLERDNTILRSGASGAIEIVGASEEMESVRRVVQKVAATDVTVLITGESGTGKELVAASIHQASSRRERLMVSINCGAIPDSMVEAELFGHEPGAFTGARERKLGRFELAHEGTLFFDEVGELPLAAQVKLLRALEQKVFYRVGGEKPVHVDVRIIAATNADLEDRAEKGEFREDLLFRLNVFRIHTPSLRERRNDIPELVEFFLRELSPEPVKVSPEGMERLRACPWKGNVRELHNLLERELILREGDLLTFESLGPMGGAPAGTGPAGRTLKMRERAHILEVLRSVGWNKKKAAEVLGIGRPSIYDKIRQHGIREGE